MKNLCFAFLVVFLLCPLAWADKSSPVAEPAQPPPRMPEQVQRPLRVGVSVIVNGITKVSDQTGSFEANVDLQLRWHDPTQAFDAREFGVDRQEFGFEAATARMAKMWVPKVSLANLQDKPQKWEPGLFIRSDGTITYVQRIKAVFDAKFKLAAFPFDVQSLPIRIVADRESSGEVILVQEQRDVDTSRITPGTALNGWSLQRIEFTSAVARGWNGAYFSQMDAMVRIKRKPLNHIPIMFVPFFLIMAAPTAMTLFTKGDVAPRVAAWGQAILAMIAFNFTLSVRYPALGSDTFMSELFSTGFGFQLLMIVFTASYFNPAAVKGLGGEDLVTEVASYLRWALPLGLTAFIVTRVLLTMAAGGV